MFKIISALVLFCALAVFAKPSEKLVFQKELQVEELPWFAFDAKDDNGTYGKTINPENLKEIIKQKKYRKVVFSFFASWCTNCLEGLKRMSNNADALKKKGVLVVLVNVAERDLSKYSHKQIETWITDKKLLGSDWLLAFDKYSNTLESFGLHKNSNEEATLPRTLITDDKLRPLVLIGAEGDDFLQLLQE